MKDAQANHPGGKKAARIVYGAGTLYFAAGAMLLADDVLGRNAIGAVCGARCGGTTLLGVPLEIFGMALMAAVLASRAWWSRSRAPLAAASCGGLALVHGAASLAFAASMWLGIVPLCNLCQVAALLSVVVAAACAPLMREAYALPALPVAKSLLIGVLAVFAAWPFLEGLKEEEELLEAPAVQAQPPANAAGADERMQLVDALTIGRADAPYELVMLTDFDCGICERFERRTLPELIERGVDTGVIRVRFLFKGGAGGDSNAYKLVAATALAQAGADPVEVFELFRRRTLQSTPQGIALHPDEAVRARAGAILAEAARSGSWMQLHAEHQRLGSIVRRQYHGGSQATPLFVMFPGRFDPARPHRIDELYVFHGFQLPGPFLEFAGIEPAAQ